MKIFFSSHLFTVASHTVVEGYEPMGEKGIDKIQDLQKIQKKYVTEGVVCGICTKINPKIFNSLVICA